MMRGAAALLDPSGPDEATLRAVRERRLTRVLGWLAATEHGRARLREAGLRERLPAADPFAALRSLDPVSKRELRAAGPGALRGARVRAGWRSSRSSGSTGEPFRMVYDPAAWLVLKILVKARARRAAGLRLADRVAVLDAVPPDREGDGGLERLFRLRRISVLRPAEEVARALERLSPDAIYGLPSALLEAARAWPGGAAPFSSRVLFTGGELLAPPARRDLREAYGCPVRDVYGTSETKEIAWECPEGGRHVNADVLHVEVLDEDGRPLPPGHEGGLVVTLLVNRAMPLVRYRTGDRGVLLAGRCPCGRALPRLGLLAGREADTLLLPGGRRLSPYALTTALERVGPIARYQVVQVRRDRLEVRVDRGNGGGPGGGQPAATEERVRAAVREAAGGRVGVDVLWVDRFETGPGGKFRVVRPLDPPGGPSSESRSRQEDR